MEHKSTHLQQHSACRVEELWQRCAYLPPVGTPIMVPCCTLMQSREVYVAEPQNTGTKMMDRTGSPSSLQQWSIVVRNTGSHPSTLSQLSGC